MDIEELISKEAKEEAQKQTNIILIKNDISFIKPLLIQLRTLGVDPSMLIDPRDSKNIFIKHEIINIVKMTLHYLYNLIHYNSDYIRMSRSNCKGTIYECLRLLRRLVSKLNNKSHDFKIAWGQYKQALNNSLDTKKSQIELKTYTIHFLEEIHK